MLRALRCDFHRVFFNIGFLSSVILTALLCFADQVYINSSDMRSYSVIESIVSFDRDFMQQRREFRPMNIINNSLSGYSAMFLPASASFPFAAAFIAERGSANMRLSMFRTGKLKYCASKFISAVVSGGACTTLGILLFSVFTFLYFPSGAENTIEIIPLLTKLLSVFLYGSSSVLLSFFLCSLCTNFYIVLCVPFLTKFVVDTALSKIIVGALADRNSELLEAITPFGTDSASRLPYYDFDRTFLLVLAANVISGLAAFAGFLLILSRRADKGA